MICIKMPWLGLQENVELRALHQFTFVSADYLGTEEPLCKRDLTVPRAVRSRKCTESGQRGATPEAVELYHFHHHQCSNASRNVSIDTWASTGCPHLLEGPRTPMGSYQCFAFRGWMVPVWGAWGQAGPSGSTPDFSLIARPTSHPFQKHL